MWVQDLQPYVHESGDLYLGEVAGAGGGVGIGVRTERHAITVAGAGAGKGACVIIPNLIVWPHNALVIDPKGEAAEVTAEIRETEFGQAVHVVDPFEQSNVDPKYIASYNPLAALDPESLTIKEDITAISDGIVMRGHDSGSAHWDDGAQRLINGLIGYVLICRDPDKRNLIEVRRILRNADEFDQVINEMRGMDGCAGVCQSGAEAVYAGEGKYFVSNAQKNTDWLDSKGMANVLSSSSFSLADLKNGKASIFLVLPANYLGQHGRFLRLFVRCAIEEMARRTPSGSLRGEQCLFLLDEFFSLGYIDEISKAAGLMRGYGLQLWPILQDIGQLVSLYGREGSETFFGNADLHQFFGNTDAMTLDFISSRFGNLTAEEVPLPDQLPSFIGDGNSFDKRRANQRQDQDKTFQHLDGLGDAFAWIGDQIDKSAHKNYQESMRQHQHAMSNVGRPRLAPDKIAEIIQKKNDVVADHIINFCYGSDKVLVKPRPWFRKSENKTEEKTPKIKMPVDTGLIFGVLVGGIVATVLWYVKGSNFIENFVIFGFLGFCFGWIMEKLDWA